MGTEGGDKCVDNVDKLRKKWCGGEKGRIRKRSAISGGGNAGRATLSWPLTSAIVHEGQRTLAKVYVGAGSQSLP